MPRKFVDGLLFGCGFAISLVIVSYASWFVFPIIIGSVSTHESIPITQESHYSKSLSGNDVNGKPFHELDLDEQIKQSSVIALAKYEPSKEGLRKAVIKEFLKKDPNTIVHYKIGDEYAPSSYYPKVNTSYGDGIVIFFVGSPASMRMSMSYDGDRIGSLGDLPLELLREKCNQPDDGTAEPGTK
jgi:hypothetical protein